MYLLPHQKWVGVSFMEATILMTHKELVEVLEHTAQDGMADEPILIALRAVVELHKEDYGFCMICPDFNYPCETIKAIEKELK